LVLHQPGPDAIAIADRVVRDGNVRATELHLALDILTSSRTAANQLAVAVSAFLDHPYSRNWAVCVSGTTRYSRPRRSATCFVIYSDVPHRFDGLTPCVHVEMRCRGSAAIKKLGVRTLAAFDIQKALTDNLRFAEPDLPGFRRAVGPDATRVLRIAQELDCEISAQGFRLCCRKRGLSPSRFLRPLTLLDVLKRAGG
jgi:hypothetical protein